MHTDLNWTDFKAIVAEKNLTMQYKQDGMTYDIWAWDHRDLFHCEIDIDDTPSADQTDFEDNYKDDCNKPITPLAPDSTPYVRVTEKTVGKFLQLKGCEFTATAGQTTNYDLVWTETIEFVGARAKAYNASTGEPDANFGDKAQMQMVDKDNILGYGAGFVLTEFGKDVPGKMLEWGCVAETTTAATMFPGLYLRISYNNTGTEDLKVVAALRYFH